MNRKRVFWSRDNGYSSSYEGHSDDKNFVSLWDLFDAFKIDTDSDGIPNLKDTDDDNDGETLMRATIVVIRYVTVHNGTCSQHSL